MLTLPESRSRSEAAASHEPSPRATETTTQSRGLTAGEIVKAIARPGEDVGTMLTRVRHWTALGLLSPIGSANRGTGRHRRYDPATTLIDFVVLNALADQGIAPVSREKPELHYALALAREAHRKWSKTRARLLLEIPSRWVGTWKPQNRVAFIHEKTVTPAVGAEGYVIIDLSLAFSRLPPGDYHESPGGVKVSRKRRATSRKQRASV